MPVRSLIAHSPLDVAFSFKQHPNSRPVTIEYQDLVNFLGAAEESIVRDDQRYLLARPAFLNDTAPGG